MALEAGAVVTFDYNLHVDGKLIQSSMEDVAHEHHLHHDHGSLKPLTVILGQRQIISGLEAALSKQAKKGKDFTVNLTAEEAYGHADPKNVKTIPMAKFRQNKIQPRLGEIINFEGRPSIITHIGGGRVRLDQNHELAGKALTYDVKVRNIVTDEMEKVQSVIDGFFAAEPPQATKDGETVCLEIPDQAKFDQNWPMAKFRLLSQLRAVTGMERDIRLTETFPANPNVAGAGEEE